MLYDSKRLKNVEDRNILKQLKADIVSEKKCEGYFQKKIISKL